MRKPATRIKKSIPATPVVTPAVVAPPQSNTPNTPSPVEPAAPEMVAEIVPVIAPVESTPAAIVVVAERSCTAAPTEVPVLPEASVDTLPTAATLAIEVEVEAEAAPEVAPVAAVSAPIAPAETPAAPHAKALPYQFALPFTALQNAPFSVWWWAQYWTHFWKR
mgnify:CR=1 FL=1